MYATILSPSKTCRVLRLLGDDDEPEWMVEFAKREASRAITEKQIEFESRLARIKREEEQQRAALESSEGPRKRQVWRAFHCKGATKLTLFAM
jgi:chromosome transmission fidelity protein 1